jgi:hypothetical protein
MATFDQKVIDRYGSKGGVQKKNFHFYRSVRLGHGTDEVTAIAIVGEVPFRRAASLIVNSGKFCGFFR